MMNSVAATSPSPLPFVPAVPDDAQAAADGPAAFARALDRAAQARDNQADRPQDRTACDDAELDTPSAAQRAAKGKRPPRAPATQPGEGAATQGARPADETSPDAQAKATEQAQHSPQSDAAALVLLDLASLMAGLAQGARGASQTAEALEVAKGTHGTHDGVLDVTPTTGQRATAQHRGNAAGRADGALTQGQDALFAASQGIESRIFAAGETMAAVTGSPDSGARRQVFGQVFDNALGSPLTQAAGAALSVPSATTAGDAAAMFQADLAAALGTPEFASALGTQIRVLIRDGVSQAQLHLNPADMGPIEVRIRLEGDNAQVDFSALQAMTRQALEDAVPALASALRESGLTLSGGGVFEQARQPQGEQPGSHAHRAAPASSATNEPAPTHGAVAHAFRARGVVDLYA